MKTVPFQSVAKGWGKNDIWRITLQKINEDIKKIITAISQSRLVGFMIDSVFTDDEDVFSFCVDS